MKLPTNASVFQAPSHALNLEDADGFYEQLLDAHGGLSRDESEALNARLVLLLANQVGSVQALTDCLAAAVDSSALPDQ